MTILLDAGFRRPRSPAMHEKTDDGVFLKIRALCAQVLRLASRDGVSRMVAASPRTMPEKTRATSVFMTTSFDSVVTLSEQELLDHFVRLVDRDRRTCADLLVTIAEIDERKIWAKHGCSSMFTFCMERFHMSEQVTAKRIWAARTARQFPAILPMVESGELHLGAIYLLASHLTPENHARVLERAKHKSSREVERLVAELAPRADVPSRIRALPGPRTVAERAGGLMAGSSDAASTSSDASSVSNVATSMSSDSGSISRTEGKPIVPLSPRRYKIEITVDEATHDKLRSLQDLLGRSATGRDPAAIISRAIDVLLDRTLARRAGCTDRPKPTQGKRTVSTSLAADGGSSKREQRSRTIPAAVQRGQRIQTTPATAQRGQRTRTIPAAVRREVWRRDSGRCCFVDACGRRCAATSNVEFHHRKPFAVGGGPTPQNIELRCAAHNQYQADLDFGRSFMDGKRGKVVNIPRGMSTDGGCGKAAPKFMDGGRGKAVPTFPGECRGPATAP
jgi:5-methylcytosine-specific restriction endonuclease McrA